MSNLRQMTIGIDFDDRASSKIQSLNRTMDESKGKTEHLGIAGSKAGKDINSGMKNAAIGIAAAGKQTNGFKNDFDRMGNQGVAKLKELGNSFKGLPGMAGNALKGIASSVASFITAPFRGAIGLVKQFGGAIGVLSAGGLIKSGIDRLSSIQDTRIGFEVMMGDTSKANAFMDEVLDFAKTTPFSFPELASSSKKLYAFGMQQDKIIPTMKAIGDASAMIGKGEEGIGVLTGAFGDMAVSSKLSLGPISQLEDQGIPALKILANQYGVNADVMRKKITSGAIDSEKAIDLLVEGMQKGTAGIAGETPKMEGLMEKLKETFRGAMGDMKSSISNAMAKIIEPAMPAITAGLSWIGTQFGKLPALVKGISNNPEIKNAFIGIKTSAGQLVSYIQGKWPAIKTTAAEIGTAIAGFIGDNIQPAIEAAVGFADKVQENWGPIKETVITLGVAVLTFTGVMKGLAIISTINKLMDAYKIGLTATTFAQNGLNAAMKANPIGFIVTGITLAVTAGVMLYRNWDTIKEKAGELGIKIQEIFGQIGDWVGGKVDFLREKALGLWQVILDNPLLAVAAGPMGTMVAAGIMLYQNWETIKERALGLWSSITESWTSLKAVTSETWAGIKTSISNSMSSATSAVSNFFSPLLGFISSAKSAWDNFKAALSNFKMPSISMPSIGLPKIMGGKGLVHGSNAAGLERVPFDGYVSELHRDESVLTAKQSNALRAAGMLKSAGERPVINMPTAPKNVAAVPNTQPFSHAAGSSSARTQNNTITINVSGGSSGRNENLAREIRDEVEKIFTRLNATMA